MAFLNFDDELDLWIFSDLSIGFGEHKLGI